MRKVENMLVKEHTCRERFCFAGLKTKCVCLIILVGIAAAVLFMAISYNPPMPPPPDPSPSPIPPSPPIHLINCEWNLRIQNWEHAYVEVNVTLFNSHNASTQFTLEIDLYDEEEYLKATLWEIELPGNYEATITKKTWVNVGQRKVSAIEIICGLYGEDDCLRELYFREFCPKGEP